MTLLNRLFREKKPEAPVVDTSRLDKVVETAPRAVRSEVYREAFVIYESGYKRRGVIMDFTDRGARIRFPTMEQLPETVTLNAKSVGINGPVRVAWQSGTEVGLELINLPPKN